MIKTMLYNRDNGDTQWDDEALFSVWADNSDTWIWADFDGEDPQREAQLFRDGFGLDPLVIADAQRERHPPKLELFDNYFFLLVIGLDATTTNLDFATIQLASFVGDRFPVTRHKAESVSIDSAWSEAKAGRVDLARGPAHAAYRILRRVTDRYSGVIEGLEHRLDTMEDEMFENPRDALLEELMAYGRNLKRLRRVFNYHQAIYKDLSRKDQPLSQLDSGH